MILDGGARGRHLPASRSVTTNDAATRRTVAHSVGTRAYTHMRRFPALVPLSHCPGLPLSVCGGAARGGGCPGGGACMPTVALPQASTGITGHLHLIGKRHLHVNSVELSPADDARLAFAASRGAHVALRVRQRRRLVEAPRLVAGAGHELAGTGGRRF
jgi:hypothetical protein